MTKNFEKSQTFEFFTLYNFCLQSGDILAQLESVGFQINEVKDVTLTKEVASKIYSGKEGEPFFDDLVNHMTEGTCKVNQI